MSQEEDRIRSAYQSYDHTDPMQQRWDPARQGNRQILAERTRILHKLLENMALFPLADKSILDIGCGSGGEVRQLLQWGASPCRLYGIDLLPHYIERARQTHPLVHFDCANAEHLPFPDESMDLVLLFTVLSSILDDTMRRRVATEAARVLKAGGAVIYYDMRYRNPRNPHVRPVGRQELRGLFPDFQSTMRSLTLLPPLARRLGPLTRIGYTLGAAIPCLRSHYAVVLRKP
jgi:SAM-dependent methyltransferase